MVDWEHGDAGGTVLRIGRDDAAIVWNSAENSWEFAMPSAGREDQIVPDAIVALAGALLMLKTEEGRQELIGRVSESHD